MLELFTGLSRMLSQSWWIALLSSFLWGILSVVLSPCHLASIPLLVGFINDRENISCKRAAFFSTIFALGILIALSLIGVVTGLLGRILGDIGGAGNYLIGVFLLFFGIYMMDIIRLPFFEQNMRPVIRKKGLFSIFFIGLIFGIALGPCAFAFMAPVLGIVFNIASNHLIYALSLLFAFAVGHCFVIVLAGTFTEAVRKFLNWNEKSNGVIWMKRFCGVLLIVAAAYFFISA